MTTVEAAEQSRQLVERFQAGDIDAFATIYQQNHDQLFRFVFFRAKNRQLAEDLTQETFVKAMRGLKHWQWQGKDVGAFLATIAKNLLFDHQKAAQQRLTTSIDFTEFDSAVPDLHREGDPESAAITLIRDTTLLKALWRLTDDQRDCLVLRFVQGLSVAETAAAMGRDENAIKSLTSRAVRAMEHHLAVTWR